MTDHTTSIIVLSSRDLASVTGGGAGLPLSGDVRQNINTNWGGSQTNINTQIVNAPQAPAPVPQTRFEYLRLHPEARWAPPPYTPRPIRPYDGLD